MSGPWRAAPLRRGWFGCCVLLFAIAFLIGPTDVARAAPNDGEPTETASQLDQDELLHPHDHGPIEAIDWSDLIGPTERSTFGQSSSSLVEPQWNLPFAGGERWQSGAPHADDGGPGIRNSLDFGPTATSSREVVAMAAGMVRQIDCAGGPYLAVDHGGGWWTTYYHMINLQFDLVGQQVPAGTILGTAAQTLPCGGSSNFDHVHVSLYFNGNAVPWQGKQIDDFRIYTTGSYEGYWTDLSGTIVLDAPGSARCCLPSSTPDPGPRSCSGASNNRGVAIGAGYQHSQTIDEPARLGTPEYWQRVNTCGGYAGDFHYTYAATGITEDNFAIWRFGERNGRYRIDCFIPANYAATRSTYEVTHANGVATPTINQANQTGWTTLGEWNFSGRPRVRLSDVNGASTFGPQGIDACRIVERQVVAATCDGKSVTIDMTTNGGNGFGTGGDDVILGTPNADTINGAAGNDTVCGGGGSDTIFGGLGNDRLFGDGGDDVLYGASGNDYLHGGVGGDTMFGQGGPDRLFGLGGDDTARGGGSQDFVYGGYGRDRLFGDGGVDRVWGGPDLDLIWGGSGDDFLYGEGTRDVIRGGWGTDTIDGGWGDDALFGEGSADTLTGGSGADAFDGGPGADICTDVVAGEMVTSC